MKKFFALFIMYTMPLFGQVGVGTVQPDASANLHVASTASSAGMLFGLMTNEKRDLISNPANGLIIYSMDDNCLQINTGTPSTPKWMCLQPELQTDTPIFSNMHFAKYKPIHPNLPNTTNLALNVSPPPTYSPTDNRLYGNITSNGSFVSNDIFKVEVGGMDGITYSSILYNKTDSPITFDSNTVAYHNSAVFKNVTLQPNHGIYIDGDTRTYYTEAQNIFISVIGPAGSPHIGRKFLIGLNIFKEDVTNAVVQGGNGTGKENQSMLTYILEFRD